MDLNLASLHMQRWSAALVRRVASCLPDAEDPHRTDSTFVDSHAAAVLPVLIPGRGDRLGNASTCLHTPLLRLSAFPPQKPCPCSTPEVLGVCERDFGGAGRAPQLCDGAIPAQDFSPSASCAELQGAGTHLAAASS